jgi:cytochrome c55X
MLRTPLLIANLMCLSGLALAEPSSSRQSELTHLLKQDCGSCHGMTLKGGLGPALLPEQLKDKHTDYLVTTILEGHPNTAMPGWKTMLSEDDALWLANQIKQGIH